MTGKQTDDILAALISALSEPVLLVDDDGIVTAANPAAVDLFGRRIDGAQIRAHLRQPEVAAMLGRVLSGGDDEQAGFTTSGGAMETIWRVNARRMAGRGLVISLRDISDIEAASAQRRDFVANVSHELRSPLTVLAGFIETLQGPAGDDPAARAEFLDIMAGQATRMTGLVEDLLSLSRVEAVGKIRPRDPVAIEDVLRVTLAALRPQAEAAGMDLVCDLPPDLPQIPGDRDQLVQVYHNLIENALKYGGSGGRVEVTASVSATMAGFDGAVLRVFVRDFGEGIDPIFIPRLTERFYRIDKARSRDSGGTGLGLAIVKHILARHRGRLVIQSTPTAGSCFVTFLSCV
ncbi:ATP-binding protein [Roseinatronobacter alkalisoli]|uniref:histidine kinase n=1 Tax=Roseinatronobacter alkalisoli TaxID=3028235 RepID=A0ABT5TDY3_9RHOB|nr:ATP-binding protein [Roseinatronobacter sp. HJB301]MDD7973335.1 ATP-binding protein [Roseinatronobacter sp. HJB301]